MSSRTRSEAEFSIPHFGRDSRIGGKLLRLSETAKHIVLFGQLYLVAMAVFAVGTVMVALSIPPNLSPVVIGLLTYAVYIGDRISDSKDDPDATADRAAFMRRHETFFSVSSATAYGIAISLAVLGGPLALAITLLPGLFWVFYATDWIPKIGLPMKRLKRVLILNSSLVAFAWGFSIVFLPIAFAEVQLTASGIFLFVYFFVTMFVSAELSNIRDIRDDLEEGVSTLPNTFGINRTRQAIYIIELGLLGLLGVSFYFGLLTQPITFAILAGLLFSLGLDSFVGRIGNHRQIAVLEEVKHIVVGVLAIWAGLI